MRFSATKIFRFEMGHQLSSAVTKECLNPHGHSYKMEVTIGCDHLNGDGMVMDFKELKEMVAPIIRTFDHQFITEKDIDCNPTAENILKIIWEMLWKQLTTWNQNKADATDYSFVSLDKIKLWETETAYITVTHCN